MAQIFVLGEMGFLSELKKRGVFGFPKGQILEKAADYLHLHPVECRWVMMPPEVDPAAFLCNSECSVAGPGESVGQLVVLPRLATATCQVLYCSPPLSSYFCQLEFWVSRLHLHSF